MVKQRRRYSRDFKLEAVRLAETSDKPVGQIEQELGICRGLIRHWRRQLAKTGEEAFPGKGHLTSQDEEVRQLRREVEILRQERDILKKAISIFSQGQR